MAVTLGGSTFGEVAEETESEKRFLRCGTAKCAVPSVEMMRTVSAAHVLVGVQGSLGFLDDVCEPGATVRLGNLGQGGGRGAVGGLG